MWEPAFLKFSELLLCGSLAIFYITISHLLVTQIILNKEIIAVNQDHLGKYIALVIYCTTQNFDKVFSDSSKILLFSEIYLIQSSNFFNFKIFLTFPCQVSYSIRM